MASQGNLNGQGLVRPGGSEDEPGRTKSLLAFRMRAGLAELGACTIRVMGMNEVRGRRSHIVSILRSLHKDYALYTKDNRTTQSFLCLFNFFFSSSSLATLCGLKDLSSPVRD